MSAVIAGETAGLGSYVQSMSTLRQDLKWALDDLAFANRGGEIAYVFDANVVALYLNPVNAVHAVRVLPEQNDEHKTVLLELATVVAEIMFSGDLPGQKEKPFVTVDHATEVVSISNAIRNKLRHEAQIGEVREDYIRKHFGPALADVNRIRTDQSPEFLRQARKEFRPLLRNVANVLLKEGVRLAKIYADDLLLNIDKVPDFDRSVLAPDVELLADWSETIFLTKQKRKKQGVAYNDPDADPFANDKIDRDATSIAQIDLLNKNADPEIRRYVLVTCDDGLMEAYASRHAVNGGFFALRHPRQYLPLADDSETDVVGDKKSLADVIDSLLVSFRNPRDTREEQSALTARVGRVHNVHKLTQEWFQLCDSAVRSSIDKLAQHIATEINILIPAFKAVDIDNALAETIRTILSDLDRLHLAIGAVGSLLRYVHEAQNKKKRGVRAPIAIKCEPLETFIGASEINEYLTQLVSSGNEAMVSALQKRLSDRLPDGEAYLPPFFAACAWLRFMAWDAAFVFARGAINQIRRLQRGKAGTPDLENALHELYYISAVADRFRMVGPRELDQANTKLEECREYHSRNHQPLWRARAISEQAALKLMRLVGSQFVQERFKTTYAEDLAMLKDALDLLHRAQEILDDQTQHAKTPFYNAIHQQVIVNLAQAAIYNFIFTKSSQLPGMHTAQLELTVDELEEIRRELRGAGIEQPVVEINFHMLRWIVSRGDPIESKLRAQEARAIIDDYLLNGDNLHDVDRKELHAYKRAVGS